MASWRDEFREDFDVPLFVNYLVNTGVLKDLSWHDDAAPAFGMEIVDDDLRTVRLWIDHPLESHRDSGGRRFTVYEGVYGAEDVQTVAFDELEPALFELFRRMAPWRGGVDEWADPEEYLRQLIVDFDTLGRKSAPRTKTAPPPQARGPYEWENLPYTFPGLEGRRRRGRK